MSKQKGLKRGFRISYKQMILDILNVVNNDFCADMEAKWRDGKVFTQEEANEMAKRLIDVYWIAHCEFCFGCSWKYRVENKKGERK